MNAFQLIRTALRSLSQHKWRSFLTILSIIVGVSALIATLAIGKGAEQKIRQKIMAMGKNYVFVHAGNRFSQGKTSAKRKKNTQYLSLKDVEVIERQAHHVAAIGGEVFSRTIVQHRENRVMTDLTGCYENILGIVDRQIARGSFFTALHVKRNARVAVLGSKAAEELFKRKDPLGKTITIEKNSFTVIGVVKKEETFLGTQDPNMSIAIPITTMKKYVLKDASPSLHAISISATTLEDTPRLVRSVKRILRYRHKLKEHDPDDFTIFDQKSMVQAAGESAGVLTLLLFIIASISLMVGGIGVMNIMLVSVTERTKEIGIRMALGANGSLIRRQFLLESVVLCCIGGLLGTLIGLAIPFIASMVTGWIVVVQPMVIVGALCVTTMIGLFFGWYPARKASMMHPVEALMDI